MEIKEKKDTDYKVLRVCLDGNWTSSEFSNLFETLSILYQLVSEIEKIETNESQLYGKAPESSISESLLNVNGELYKKLNFSSSFENAHSFEGFFRIRNLSLSNKKSRILKNDDLQIKEIKYASPGFTDFVGAGKIIEQIFSLLRYYFPNKKEKLENEILEQELITRKVQTLEIMGYSKKEIRKYLDARNNVILNLDEFQEEKKIVDFEVRDLN